MRGFKKFTEYFRKNASQNTQVKKTSKDNKNWVYIEEVSKITKWDIEHTKAMMDETRARTGCSYRVYCKYKLYELDPDEQKKVCDDLRKKKEAREKRNKGYIEEVTKNTGWAPDYAKKLMDKAKKDLGCSYRDYNRYRLYDLNSEEQADRYRRICEETEIRKREKKIKSNSYIDAVAENTGWERDYAKKMMDEAREKLGCSYWIYFNCKFYELNFEEQALKYQEVKKESEHKKENVKNTEQKCILEIMKETGWDEKKTIQEVENSIIDLGCNYEEYADYRLYDYSKKIREQLFFKSLSKRIIDRYETNKNLAQLVKDKKRANECFAKYIRRPWCLNYDITFEEFSEKFKGCKRIFYKPINLSGGRGAVPFDISENNLKEVYEEVITYPKGVVEKYIVQHHAMNNLSPTTVNSMRIGTVSSDIKPVTSDGKYVDIAYVVQKMGGADSVVDNLHQGGVAAIIDKETGIICTDGIDQYSNILEKHPVSGTTIKGFEIPYYQQAIEMVKEIISEYNMAGHFGWDVCIEEDGPTLIEINSRPAPLLPTHPLLVTEHRGIKKEMEKYLY